MKLHTEPKTIEHPCFLFENQEMEFCSQWFMDNVQTEIRRHIPKEKKKESRMNADYYDRGSPTMWHHDQYPYLLISIFLKPL